MTKKKRARRPTPKTIPVDLRMPRDLHKTLSELIEGTPFELQDLVNALLVLGIVRDARMQREQREQRHVVVVEPQPAPAAPQP